MPPEWPRLGGQPPNPRSLSLLAKGACRLAGERRATESPVVRRRGRGPFGDPAAPVALRQSRILRCRPALWLSPPPMASKQSASDRAAGLAGRLYHLDFLYMKLYAFRRTPPS